MQDEAGDNLETEDTVTSEEESLEEIFAAATENTAELMPHDTTQDEEPKIKPFSFFSDIFSNPDEDEQPRISHKGTGDPVFRSEPEQPTDRMSSYSSESRQEFVNIMFHEDKGSKEEGFSHYFTRGNGLVLSATGNRAG